MDKVMAKVIRIAGILAIAASVAAIALVAYASSFSVMIADDFFFAQDTGRKISTLQYLRACWDHMAYEYVTWQGTFLSELFNSMFNPVNVGGFEGLRVIMVINAIATFLSFILLVFLMIQFNIDKEYSLKWILLGACVFALTEYDVFPEIFFWYTGAMAVSVPFTLSCLALSALILLNHQEKNIWMIIACVLGFLSAGGSLSVGGTLCYLAIVIILYHWICDKKLDKKNLVVFMFFFGGSLINALSPGNFVRQGIESSNSVTLLQTIANVWKVYAGEIEWLFVSNNFGAVLCVVLICGVLASEKSLFDRKASFVSAIVALFTPAVTIFPVVLGYRVPWIPNRCRLVTTQMLILSLGGLALLLGVEIGRLVKGKKNLVAAGLFAAALILVLISDLSPRSYRSVRIAKCLYDHTYQDNYKATRDLMDYLKDHPGQDLVLDVPTTPEIVEYYYSFYLLDSVDDRVNRAVSWAYDLNSVRSSRDYGN